MVAARSSTGSDTGAQGRSGIGRTDRLDGRWHRRRHRRGYSRRGVVRGLHHRLHDRQIVDLLSQSLARNAYASQQASGDYRRAAGTQKFLQFLL